MSLLFDIYLFSLTAEQGAEQLVDKGLDSAVSFSQSLSQWAYITIGASVALLLKDFDRRPNSRAIRWSFGIFVPGWLCLACAIYKGVRVHGAYIAYLMSPRHDSQDAIRHINADAASQVAALGWGLTIFFIWLFVYLLWWIKRPDEPKGI